MTPNEWDTAITLGNRYFIYRLVVNEQEKKLFAIQDPYKLQQEKKLIVHDNWAIELKQGIGQWQPL